MPCSDGRDDEPRIEYRNINVTVHKEDAQHIAAIACSALAFIEGRSMMLAFQGFHEETDRDSGISLARLRLWWSRHKQADKLRREREAKEAAEAAATKKKAQEVESRLEKLRASGIAKLTEDEAIALGVALGRQR